MEATIIAALIAASISLVISLLSLYESFKKQKTQRELFEKEQYVSFLAKLYELRLSNYPKAFEITDLIRKEKGENINPEIVNKVRKELYAWKSSIVSLIISYDTIVAFRDLRDSLNKNPAFGEKYAKEQIDKIWETRSEFRKCLRRDIGLLHKKNEI